MFVVVVVVVVDDENNLNLMTSYLLVFCGAQNYMENLMKICDIEGATGAHTLIGQ